MISAVREVGSTGGGSVRASKAARAGELKVSQVHAAKATSNVIAIRTDDRLGGRRTITAQSSQQDPTRGVGLHYHNRIASPDPLRAWVGAHGAARVEVMSAVRLAR